MIAASLIRNLLYTSLAAFVAFPIQEPPQQSVLDAPRIQALNQVEQSKCVRLMSQGDYAEAEQRLRLLIDQVPQNPSAHYNLCCALSLQGKNDEAFTYLENAIEQGFRNPKHIESDQDLIGLRDDDRFPIMLHKAAAPFQVDEKAELKYAVAAVASDGQVIVTGKNVAWIPRLGLFRVKLAMPEPADSSIAKGLGSTGELLRSWYEEGTAAGNVGDMYDNHDTDHSNMNFRAFPQLTRIEFSDDVKKRQLHHGLQRHFLYNRVTIGNSSTALVSGVQWRSQGRFAMTQSNGAALLHLHYRTNHLYFYPEHRDHDPPADGKGHGDVFPANTPYMIISQGSSGSDKPFMNAVAQTLAAFHPKVKARLTQSGMLMPTVQLIFRSSNKLVETEEDYLSGKAHPTVFDAKHLDVMKMVMMAHDMVADIVPPLVQLQVTQENNGTAGRDFFSHNPSERLFDTPCAIARLAKSIQYERRMVVSAAKSADLNNLKLTYHWRVLRGDEERIQIKPLNPQSSVVEIRIPFHDRQPVGPESKLGSNRVDIGVFVHNGHYYSAPGFVSVLHSNAEKREYDKANRIQVVDYNAPEFRGRYVDPLLELRKQWRDEYMYDDEGKLSGWNRDWGKNQQEFSANGKLIERDENGLVVKTSDIQYVVKPVKNKSPILVPDPGPKD